MSVRALLLLVLAVNSIAIVIAVLLGEDPRQYFGERTFITYLSGFQLLFVAGLAWKIFLARKDQTGQTSWRKPNFIWCIIAIAFVYLSVDEVAKIHENIDDGIHSVFRIEQTAVTDRIDDIIVGAYGIIALFIFYFYREELKKYRASIPLFVLGFLCMFLMVGLDILSNRNDILPFFISDTHLCEELFIWFGAVEDMCKMIAECFFIGAFFLCLKTVRHLC